MLKFLISNIDTRYVSSPEACYRLFEFLMQGKSHFVYRLAVHLEDEQPLVFDPDQIENDLETTEIYLNNEATLDTHLLGWFRLNQEDEEANDFKYCDLAKHYTWNKETRRWQVRKRGHEKAISRIHPVSIKNTELFYMRVLLQHITGCKSFENIRTTYTEDGGKFS